MYDYAIIVCLILILVACCLYQVNIIIVIGSIFGLLISVMEFIIKKDEKNNN